MRAAEAQNGRKLNRMPWKIASGPRKYKRACYGDDIDIGWSWTLERAGNERPIRVEVAGGRLNVLRDLEEDSVAAIRSQGRTAIAEYLEESEPPIRIKVTSGGLLSYYDD
jgi:hypothetical protein